MIPGSRNLILAAAATAALLTPTAAGAIVAGTVDGTTHPNVAMISFVQPDGRFRCSATLISPTVLVTAAHCTVGTIGKTIVTFAPEAPSPGPAPDVSTGYVVGLNIPAGYVTGTAHAHPLWADKLQLNNLHDTGVVVLDRPVVGITPAALPPLNYLESLTGKGVLQRTSFTSVGYGVFFQKSVTGPQKPDLVSDRIRRNTTSVGQNLTSQVLMLSENSNDSRAGGGTCFGDSGGPTFQGGYVVADTSFGGSQFCRGSGGSYRLDTADARSFLANYVTLP
ncbi:MAG: trypsin-like serine protease [Acidimicrobiia bacterium]